jgi:hypothetical protein
VDERLIARLPTDPCGDDEYCSICGDDNVVLVIQGRSNCAYCGNQVNLCSKHCGQMLREVGALNLGLPLPKAVDSE